MFKKKNNFYDDGVCLNILKINNFFYNNFINLTNLEDDLVDDLFFEDTDAGESEILIHVLNEVKFDNNTSIEKKLFCLLVSFNFKKNFFLKFFFISLKSSFDLKVFKNNLNLPNSYKTFFYKTKSNIFINPLDYSFSFTSAFLKKNFLRNFFKLKVQKKEYTFYKNVIEVDIFNKKLEKSFDFEINFLSNKNLSEKIENSFNFASSKCEYYCLIKNKIIHFYTYSFFEKSFNSVFFENVFKWKFTLYTKKKNMYESHRYENRYFTKKPANFEISPINNYIYNISKLLNNKNSSIMPNYSYSGLFPEFSNQKNSKKPLSYNYLPNQIMLYNNYLPYYNIYIKSRFYKNVILRNNLNPSFINYYNYYLLNFLEIFLKKNIWLKVNTKSTAIINKNTREFIQTLYRDNRLDQISLGRHFYLLEFLEIMFISFFYRDLKFFSYWIKKTMEKLHLKKHKKFLKVIHNMLKNNTEFLLLLGVKGFNMDVRGKLGTTGNSKKKHYAFTVGAMSPTSKNHDMSFNQTTVRTSTGVLGVSLVLSY